MDEAQTLPTPAELLLAGVTEQLRVAKGLLHAAYVQGEGKLQPELMKDIGSFLNG